MPRPTSYRPRNPAMSPAPGSDPDMRHSRCHHRKPLPSTSAAATTESRRSPSHLPASPEIDPSQPGLPKCPPPSRRERLGAQPDQVADAHPQNVSPFRTASAPTRENGPNGTDRHLGETNENRTKQRRWRDPL